MKSTRTLLAIVILLFATFGLIWITDSALPSKSAGRPRRVTVAAAADLQFAFEDLTRAFHEYQSEIQVQTTYGASGNFFAQLNNRAPFGPRKRGRFYAEENVGRSRFRLDLVCSLNGFVDSFGSRPASLGLRTFIPRRS